MRRVKLLNKLMLLMRAGDNMYAIDSTDVVEVIPRVKINKIPHSPEFILGQINFSGKPVPVGDLSILIEGRESKNSLHTRIVLLKSSLGNGQIFGLLAENMTDAVELNRKDFTQVDLSLNQPSFSAGILNKEEKIIHLLDVDKLSQLYMR